ncbi:unnamed protein product [Brassica oleracea]
MMKSLTLLDLISLVLYLYNVAISSGTAGSSSDGAENTAAIVVGGLSLIAIAAASSKSVKMLQLNQKQWGLQRTVS